MKMSDIFSLCYISRESIIISVQFKQLIIIFVSLTMDFLWSTWRLFSESSRQYQNFSRHGHQNSLNLEGCYYEMRWNLNERKEWDLRLNETERVWLELVECREI